MSGAYAPISAIIMSEEFYARLLKGSDEKGWFAHAGTYHAHPVAAVKNDHHSTIRISTRRGPMRSASQPPGISKRA